MLVVNSRLAIPLEELQFTYSRSAGPGGQNVNKVSSKATLHWNVLETANLPEDVRQRFLARYANRLNASGELVLSSQRYREQRRNVADCLSRLRQMILEVALPPTPRKATKPSQGSRERRLRQKKYLGEKKRSRQPPGSES
ncbi:MAG: aminoacyl-tRNA hydrolase [Pirellulaceae bacterium]|nr:aminoacyl-tRNA hydrolase [Pirellulaceae bacterium]